MSIPKQNFWQQAGGALKGTGIIGSVIGGGLSLLGNHINQKRARKQAAQERQWNIEDWNRVNEYNTPQAQMQRMKDANLNPNLMYGQGSPGLAGDIGQSESHQAQFTATDNALSEYYNFEKHQAGMDMIQKQTRSIDLENKRKRAQLVEELKHMAANATNEAAKKMYETQIKEMEMTTMAEMRAGFENGDLIYKDGNIRLGEGPQNVDSYGKFKNLQEIQNLNSQAQAEKWINEQNWSSQEKRARITELNELIDNMPEGINPVQWIQAMIKYLMSK